MRVAAASDLQSVLPALAERFRKDHGVEVVTTIGSSGNLARQVRQGAPFDLFLSANRRYVEDLADEGVIAPETVAPYAVGVLVLAVNRASGGAIEGLEDLSGPGSRRSRWRTRISPRTGSRPGRPWSGPGSGRRSGRSS